ncbi:NACHT, LRR and PYD domains-containing protein 3 [Hydra vulgaris]|uniref:NACHT, LRR and PYD domains-containing protein 3 n=1 Tax=Hydra vulgaris TaxID=6087 RepID=UPI001F5F4F1B|nr:NACHT, LRR and PYD domains-containing protein 3-like isoform X1 [Hydra vulgaris]XP_047135655.1 NACHT, LRR and PYD domains-containing protein 3-like isoform X1 [Hydra vulgaris]XP_047135656.1 NACHT, LRR and PYD domains-containing protein 3-like isoform X1 [Hydra vulgaris]XP_047135657.1 NACHT, LRR and PYD domains-containing protein 3-like isoform X1 [Hydra vulgaris]
MEQYNSHSKKDNNILLSQEFKLNFSESVGVDWRTLGRRLNIEDNYLDMIDQDNNKTNAKAYSMLLSWMQMNNNPTLEELKKALRNMKRMDLIRKVDEFTNFLYSSEITCSCNVEKDISEICTALKSFYLTNYGKIDEIQPPLKSPANVDLMHKFVDLCIVDAVNTQIDAVYSVERKKFFEKQLCYTPIPYSEIFMKEKSFTLISGIAGIGKTWLLRKCLLDWSNDIIWKNVKLVFYLECRRLNQFQNISNINELLNVFYKDIINDFSISNHNALFIIDGLDEFKYLNELINPSSNCNYPIVNVFKETQKYKYIVAGRVYAINQYQSISTEHSDKLTIQIMGFNENGINNYIENNVLEEKKDVVKATLKESPIAKSMSSVPFYLSSMCKIISDSKNVDKNSFLTMTDLYANIFLYFLQKHILKSNQLIYQIMENDFNKKYVLNICKIAYQLFLNNKVIFSKEDIQTLIIGFDENKDNFFGFIERIETNLGYYYQFVHLTIMEFCASVYAYNCLSSEDVIANKRLESCLSMICGLTNKSQNSLLKFLANLNPSKKSFFPNLNLFSKLNPSKKAYEDPLFFISVLDRLLKLSRQSDDKSDLLKVQFETYYVNLFIECFYESQSSFTDEMKLIVDEREWWISIDDRKTSYEFSYENYFVYHFIKSGKKLSWLYVSKNILSSKEKNLLTLCSTNVRDAYFYCPIKFEGWKPENKFERLWIDISSYLITKKDLEENFLPWINLCEELTLGLNDDIDFIKEVYEWIRCLNFKKLRLYYRGKNFYNLDELKNFI